MSQNIGQLVAELNALVSKMETQRGVCVTVAVGRLGAAAAKLLEAGGLISTACDVVSTYASSL